jgi:hypothetical protein
MKRPIIFLVVLAASASAHAQLLVPKDSKATLSVKYEYIAKGEKKDKYDPKSWDVHRGMSIDVQLVAGKSQALATLRPMEQQQLADIQKKQAAALSIAKKQAPMMADMLQIVQRCGENEDCIAKAVQGYGNTMDPSQVDANKAERAVIEQEDKPRYQSWKAVSQKGIYAVTEVYRATTADPACMEKPGARCHRQEIRKGGGDIPPSPDKTKVSYGLFEVDSVKKDIWLTFPGPTSLLPYKIEVTSNFPEEGNSQSRGFVTGAGVPTKPLIVSIPGDLTSLSGTQSYKMDGAEAEGGTLVVTWKFSRQ